MNKCYPQDILDDALRTVVTICVGSLKKLNEKKMLISYETYDELERRFTYQLNQSLDFWNQIYNLTVHEPISEWVECELITGDPRPVILKKLDDSNFIIRGLLQDYKEKYLKYREYFFDKRLKPMFTIEIEIYAFRKLLKDNPAEANAVVDKINFTIGDKINNEYSGRGGWLNDTDSFRFRFETMYLQNVIDAANFSIESLQKLKTDKQIPDNLTILIGIGYGKEIELISGSRMGSSVIDARDIIDYAKIKGPSRHWDSIGKVRNGQVVCFLSRLSYKQTWKMLEGKVQPCKCLIRRKKKTIYEL